MSRASGERLFPGESGKRSGSHATRYREGVLPSARASTRATCMACVCAPS